MTVEELDVKITKLEAEESDLLDQKAAVRKRKVGSKRKQLKELDDLLKEKRKFMCYLEAIKDSKIPFYEKLPKDSQFYLHYMKLLQSQKIGEASKDQVSLEKQTMNEVKQAIMEGLSPPKISKEK